MSMTHHNQAARRDNQPPGTGFFMARVLAHKGQVALGFFFAMLATLCTIGLLALAGWFITASAIAGATAGAFLFNFFGPSAGIRAFALGRTGFRYLERLVNHDATFRALADLRLWLFRRLIPLSPARLGHQRSGELLSRMTGDIDALDGLYLRVMLPGAIAVLVTVAAIVLIALVSPLLAGIVGALMLVSGVIVPVFLMRASGPAGIAVQRGQAGLRTAVIDGVQGLTELLLAGRETAHARALDERAARLIAAQSTLATLDAIGAATAVVATGLSMVAVLAVCVPMVEADALSVPMLALLLLAMPALFEVTGTLPAAFRALGQIREAARRLGEVAIIEPAVTAPETPVAMPQGFTLCFEGVTHRYQGRMRPALEDVSLRLEEGEKLAILGTSGSGKSTLAWLAQRFEDPGSGRITLGGVDIAALDPEQLRARITVMSQNSGLIAGTIATNLRLGAPDAGLAEMERALAMAGLDRLVADLPDGLHTWVGEGGVRFSGGEARRIAIARAALRDAPVLILDEPTEGLDAATAALVQERLGPLMENRSVMTITHHATGLAGMDRIIVLDQGHVVEQGVPSDLLQRAGSLASRMVGVSPGPGPQRN